MDPLAHTLVGAALAKSGLEKRSRFAAAALVLGANLPDVDGVTYFVGGDLGLLVRRGWTHGIPAILVLPFALAGALVLLDRLLGPGRARFQALLPLSLLAVATHPALDWLNNYGMRWLMPLDGHWFYGDAVFIVDPWIWITLGGAVFLATSRGVPRTLAWMALAAAVSLLFWRTSAGLPFARILFFSGLSVLAALRLLGRPRDARTTERVSQGALALVAVYIVSLIGLAQAGRRYVRAELEREGMEVQSLMVGPRPITPFLKDVVVQMPGVYRYGELSTLPMDLRLEEEAIPRPGPSPIVSAAMAATEVRGFVGWARFPWAEVVEQSNGYRVILRDARYARRGGGFGTAVVHVPRETDGEESNRRGSAEGRADGPLPGGRQ